MCNYSAHETHFNSFSFFSLISSRRARRLRASSSSFSPSRNRSLLRVMAWASRSRTCCRTSSAWRKTCCWCCWSFSFSRLMSCCWTLRWQGKRFNKSSDSWVYATCFGIWKNNNRRVLEVEACSCGSPQHPVKLGPLSSGFNRQHALFMGDLL